MPYMTLTTKNQLKKILSLYLYKLHLAANSYSRRLTRKRCLRVVGVVVLGSVLVFLSMAIVFYGFQNNFAQPAINEKGWGETVSHLFKENKKIMPPHMTDFLQNGEARKRRVGSDGKRVESEAERIKSEAERIKSEAEMKFEKADERYFTPTGSVNIKKEAFFTKDDIASKKKSADDHETGDHDAGNHDITNQDADDQDSSYHNTTNEALDSGINSDEENDLLIKTKLLAIDSKNLTSTDMQNIREEILSYINDHVDYCLQHSTREEQNKCFLEGSTLLPLEPIKMTLTTAVYKLGTAKVIKRVIMKSSLNEDEISISMKHPNIVNTYETFRTRFVDMNGNVQNLIWLVSEYIDGKITQKWVNRDETKIRMIMRDMLRALEYMHSKQVAHIDLKIANMMLKSRETDNVAKNEYSVPENSLDEDNYETKNKDKSKNERIGINNRPKKTLEDYYIGKLIDFGFSRRIDGNEVYVKHKAFGTYPYKPPEVIYENIHGFAGDIWCVGAIAWFLSLGKTPFYFENGEKDMDSFKRFLNGKPTVNKEYLAKGYRINKNMWFRRETSYELEDFIMKCMKRNRRRRPTVKELLEHDFIKNKKSVRTYEHDWFTTDESYSSSGSINMKL